MPRVLRTYDLGGVVEHDVARRVHRFEIEVRALVHVPGSPAARQLAIFRRGRQFCGVGCRVVELHHPRRGVAVHARALDFDHAAVPAVKLVLRDVGLGPAQAAAIAEGEEAVAAALVNAADEDMRILAFVMKLGGVEHHHAALHDRHRAVEEQLAPGNQELPAVDQDRAGAVHLLAGSDRHRLPRADDAVRRDLRGRS